MTHTLDSCCGSIKVDALAGSPPDDVNPTTLSGFLVLEAYLLLWIGSRNQSIKDKLSDTISNSLAQFNPAKGDNIAQVHRNIEKALILASGRSLQTIAPLVTKAQQDMGKRVLSEIEPDAKYNPEGIEWLTQNTDLLYAKYFNQNLSDKAREIIATTYAVYGHDTDLFIEKATKAMESIPNATDRYWQAVTTNGLNLARSYTLLSSMKANNIRGYRIVAVIDSRTTVICQALDGKEFLVSQALPMFDNIANATSIEELSQYKPMVTGDKDGNFYANGEQFDANVSSDELARMGVMFPPFHWGCRSTIEPI